MPSSAQISASVRVQDQDPSANGDNNINEAFEIVQNLLPGLSLNGIDRVLVRKRATFTTSPTALDLNTFTDRSSGAAKAFAKVCFILVINHGDVGNLNLGGNSNEVPYMGAAADFIKVLPKGFQMIGSIGDAYVVTASTGDIVQVAASAGSIVGTVVILGRSA